MTDIDVEEIQGKVVDPIKDNIDTAGAEIKDIFDTAAEVGGDIIDDIKGLFDGNHKKDNKTEKADDPKTNGSTTDGSGRAVHYRQFLF
jgi:hypothetical protein